MGVGQENDALGLQLAHAPVNEALVELEIGNAIAQQSADLVVFLEHDDPVSGPRQLLRTGQPGRAGTDDADPFVGAVGGYLRLNPAFFPALVNNGAFDGLDGDRLVGEVEGARRLARRRADPSGEFGEIVGLVQKIGCFAPVIFVGQVDPIGDAVFQRASGFEASRVEALDAYSSLQCGQGVGVARFGGQEVGDGLFVA